MSKHFNVILWFPLLFWVLFTAYHVVLYMNSYVELEEYILGVQVNYATDSAVAEMLEYSVADVDYADGDFIIIEPDLALQDFTYCMAYNLDYVPTESNMRMLQSKYIRSMVVVAYDGVYGYFGEYINSSDYGLVQTPKIPYFYTEGDTQYCLTLNADKGYYGYGNASGFHMERYNNYPLDRKPSADRQSTAIITTITDIINWTLAESYGAGKSDIKVEIPATSRRLRDSVNTIESPTMITVFEGEHTVFGSAPIAEVIGGSSFEEAVRVVGFTFSASNPLGLPAGKFYATETWWANHTSLANDPSLSGARYFDTVFDAAKAGYIDISYID